jgi:hypothetical protein
MQNVGRKFFFLLAALTALIPVAYAGPGANSILTKATS